MMNGITLLLAGLLAGLGLYGMWWQRRATPPLWHIRLLSVSLLSVAGTLLLMQALTIETFVLASAVLIVGALLVSVGTLLFVLYWRQRRRERLTAAA